MKIDSIEIDNINGIKKLNIDMNGHINIICGMNGVGKSTILDVITQVFSHNFITKLKRNVRADRGFASVIVDGHKGFFDTNSFLPNDNQRFKASVVGEALKFIYIKEHRMLDHQPLGGITPDEPRQEIYHKSEIINGVRPHTIKTWLANRVLFEPQGRFSEAELYNLDIAKRTFSIIDKSVEFSFIDHTSLDIMVNTSRGEIFFEYLSTGYKSLLFILLGIIKEIEFNFNPKIKVTEFDGIILIDEADAHIHPYWQAPLIQALRTIFSSAQIIITTHSPHMIQAAESDELIALGLNEDEEVVRLETIKSEYGFKGWTVEEILEDVMGLSETRSNDYISVRKDFEDALEDEDHEKAAQSYQILSKMLHPRSPMRKILEIQLGSLGD
ncbi:AAA family ATPase [Paenibacillus xylanexedens]|uniref:AAA family ATPase n=1 Tax=Paenibacillus xylanexedens TaxID=528191 RepID=UPI0011A8AD23|nr:AAA family ATPase [Paenibacillus xylanexedens]